MKLEPERERQMDVISIEIGGRLDRTVTRFIHCDEINWCVAAFQLVVLSHRVIHLTAGVKVMRRGKRMTSIGDDIWRLVHIRFDVFYKFTHSHGNTQTRTPIRWEWSPAGRRQMALTPANLRWGNRNYWQIMYKLRFAAARTIHCVSFNFRFLILVGSHEMGNFAFEWTFSTSERSGNMRQ